MKSVWENSVMIGLRDVQREGMGRLVVDHPGYFAALDGRFEHAAADAILTVGDRYFLFELKGTVQDVRSEWSRTVKDPQGNDQITPKQVHQKLMEQVRQLRSFDSVSKEEAKRWVELSMRCHLFAYWRHEKVSPTPKDLLGEILASPYISTTLTRLLAAEEDTIKRSGFGGKMALAISEKAVRDLFELEVTAAEGDPFKRVDAMRAHDICNDAVRMRAPNSDVFGLGVDHGTFAEYLNFLQSGLADEEMRAVIYCPQSGLFRYVEKLSELVPPFESAVDPKVREALWLSIQDDHSPESISMHQKPKVFRG